MDLASLVSSWSKDRNRQVGAVIVDHRNVVVSLGWNGFPRGVDDGIDCRHDRPNKYFWTEHAERNAIYNAASTGHRLMDCRIYTTLFPCAECGRAIIQSGIKEVISQETLEGEPRYALSFSITRELFDEAKVVTRFLRSDGAVPL